MSLGRRVVGNELSGSACKRFKYFFAKLTLVQAELSERLTLEQLYNSLGGEGIRIIRRIQPSAQYRERLFGKQPNHMVDNH